MYIISNALTCTLREMGNHCGLVSTVVTLSAVCFCKIPLAAVLTRATLKDGQSKLLMCGLLFF